VYVDGRVKVGIVRADEPPPELELELWLWALTVGTSVGAAVGGSGVAVATWGTLAMAVWVAIAPATVVGVKKFNSPVAVALAGGLDAESVQAVLITSITRTTTITIDLSTLFIFESPSLWLGACLYF